MSKKKNGKDYIRLGFDEGYVRVSKKKYEEIVNDGYYYLNYDYITTDSKTIKLRNIYKFNKNENKLIFSEKEIVHAPKDILDKIELNDKIGKLECVAKPERIFGYDKKRIEMIKNVNGFFWGKITKII